MGVETVNFFLFVSGFSIFETPTFGEGPRRIFFFRLRRRLAFSLLFLRC